MENRKRVAIVGAGVVGRALAIVLRDRGYRIVGVASRRIESAGSCAALVGCEFYSTDPVKVSKLANLIFISTPDGAIEVVCDEIAAGGGFKGRDIVVHLSGALGSDVLDSARGCGAFALALHPIQTFADYQVAAQSLIGSYFSLEGDEEALKFGISLVNELEGKAILISADHKPVYHAALCVASNYLVTIVDLAVQMLRRSGVKEEDTLPMLMPLIRGTVENLEKLGLPWALTGPISRGDVDTLERQLIALGRSFPQSLEIYRKLGELTTGVGERKGSLRAEDKERIQKLLGEPGRN